MVMHDKDKKNLKPMTSSWEIRHIEQTLLEMLLKYRGYESISFPNGKVVKTCCALPEGGYLVSCAQQFSPCILIVEKSSSLQEDRTDDDHRLLIFFAFQEKLNIDWVKSAVEYTRKAEMRHVMIIYQSVITSSARKALDNLLNYKIELFESKQLVFNLTKHFYYCPHRRCTSKEVEMIKKKVGGNLSVLPKILRTDAVSRFMLFEKNDVIEIQRRSGIPAYRIVK